MTYKIIKRSEETDGRLGFRGPFPKHHHRIEVLRLLPPLPQAENRRREAAGEIRESPANGSPAATAARTHTGNVPAALPPVSPRGAFILMPCM